MRRLRLSHAAPPSASTTLDCVTNGDSIDPSAVVLYGRANGQIVVRLELPREYATEEAVEFVRCIARGEPIAPPLPAVRIIQ